MNVMSRTYAVAELSFGATLKIALLQLQYRRKADVLYFEYSSRHNKFAVLLGKLCGIEHVNAFPLRMGDFISKSGSNMWFEKDRIAGRIASQFLQPATIARVSIASAEKIDTEYLSMDLKRRINRDVSEDLNFCCALSEIASQKSPGMLIGVIRRSLFTQWIRTEFPNLALEDYYDDRSLMHFIRECGGVARQYLSAVSVRNRTQASRDALRPTVAVQFSPGARLTTYDSFPWLNFDIVDPASVLVYDDGLKPIPGPIRLAIQKSGARTLRFDSFRPEKSRIQYLTDLRRAASCAIQLLFNRDFSLSKNIWLCRSALGFWRGFARWRSFFTEYNIKVHVHIGDSDALLIARMAALESEGGIDMSFQFSGTGWMLPMNARPAPQHQFFSWGRMNVEMILRCDRECPVKAPNVFFIGGHMHHYLADLEAPEVKHAADELRSRGVKFVVAGIDSAMGDDVAPTPRHTEAFYRGLADVVREVPDIGILLKPHSASHLTKAISALIDAPDLGGRILRLPASLRPFQVFSQVDFVVSHGANNSSALEAGIAGKPHVYFDIFQWDEPVLRGIAPPELFVTSSSELAEVVRRQIVGQNSIYTSEQWYRYIDSIDPFRDKRAPHRFARLIAWLLAEIADRGDAKAAMPSVVKQYGDEFGKDRGILVVRWPYAPEDSDATRAEVRATQR